MEDNLEILKLRVLLCFLPSSETKGTVTGIARTLNKEKYVISRIVSALEKDGLIDRSDVRNPVLTEEGYRQAMRYSERLEISMNHLLCKGVDIDSARQDALIWSRFCSDETMEMVRDMEKRFRVKRELQAQKQFGGSDLCRLLKDGSYQVPFILYRMKSKDQQNLSMANSSFEHPCTLLVKDGIGTVHLRSVDMRRRDIDGEVVTAKVQNMKYSHNGWLVNAESSGGVFSFPAEALSFVNFGSSGGMMMHGSVYLQFECVPHHSADSNAIFTIMF